MKKAFLVLCFLGFFLLTYSQQTIKRTSNWSLFFENDHVKMHSKYMNCEIPEDGIYAENIILKAENKTNETIKLSWFDDTYFKTGCSNCDRNRSEVAFELTLLPKQIIQGNCESGLNNGLQIFSKWLRTPNPNMLERLVVSEVKTLVNP